jgi:succinate dehydrogenase/fumarate reductase-like Fe-S protein
MSQKIARVEIIRRDNPSEPGAAEVFMLPFAPDKTVLQVLMEVYGRHDRSLAFRRVRCNRGVCGACMVVVDGRVKRACCTLMAEQMSLEPVGGFPLVKDLVVDLCSQRD